MRWPIDNLTYVGSVARVWTRAVTWLIKTLSSQCGVWGVGCGSYPAAGSSASWRGLCRVCMYTVRRTRGWSSLHADTQPWEPSDQYRLRPEHRNYII